MVYGGLLALRHSVTADIYVVFDSPMEWWRRPGRRHDDDDGGGVAAKR